MSEPIADVLPLKSVFDMTDGLAIVRKNDVADMKDPILEQAVGVDALAAYVEGQGSMRAESKSKKTAVYNRALLGATQEPLLRLSLCRNR